jgi:hypothetical protein
MGAEPADIKVNGPVVELVPIAVMYNFPSLEFAPELPFCDHTMNQFTGVTKPFVTLVVDV